MSQVVCSGTAVSFSVVVSAGSGRGITYQWKKNGTDISGATSSSYSIPLPTGSDAGNYTVAVTSCATTVGSYTATLSVSAVGTWLGVNKSWNDAQNWCGGIPTLSSDVTIPVTGSGFYPTVSSAAFIHNITIAANASLTVYNATLQIAGTITNSGTFDAANGTIEMNGSSEQTIPANTFVSNSVNNLIVSNSSSGGVTLGGL